MQLELLSEAETYTKEKPRERFYGYGKIGEARKVHAQFIETMYPLFGFTTAPKELAIRIKEDEPIERAWMFLLGEGFGGIFIGGSDGNLYGGSLTGAIRDVIAHETSHYLHMRYLTGVKKLNFKNYNELGLPIRELVAEVGSQTFFEIGGEEIFDGFDPDSRISKLSNTISKIGSKINLLEQICRKTSSEEIIQVFMSFGFYEDFKKIEELFRS